VTERLPRFFAPRPLALALACYFVGGGVCVGVLLSPVPVFDFCRFVVDELDDVPLVSVVAPESDAFFRLRWRRCFVFVVVVVSVLVCELDDDDDGDDCGVCCWASAAPKGRPAKANKTVSTVFFMKLSLR
jgi:hypothetical protein